MIPAVVWRWSAALVLAGCGQPRLVAIDDGRVAVPSVADTDCAAPVAAMPEQCLWPMHAASRELETTFGVALDVAPDGTTLAVRELDGVAEDDASAAVTCATAMRFEPGDGAACRMRIRLRRYASDVGPRRGSLPGAGCTTTSAPPGGCEQNFAAPWP